MAENNDTGVIEEVRTLLSEQSAISTKSGLKLSLRLQMKMYNTLTEQGKLIRSNSDRIANVERSSIIMWTQRHPKLTIFLVATVVILTTLIALRVVIAKALGIDL